MKKVYAVADEVPEFNRHHITPGKMYLVDDSKAARGFYFTDDLGRTIFAAWENSVYLGGGGDWRRVEKDDTTIEGVEPGEHSTAAGSVYATLEERGKRYGEFLGHASITQQLKLHIHEHSGWQNLCADQREALDMIVHKIGRILNGDPNYADSWHDIAGYARLVDDRLMKEQKK